MCQGTAGHAVACGGKVTEATESDATEDVRSVTRSPAPGGGRGVHSMRIIKWQSIRLTMTSG